MTDNEVLKSFLKNEILQSLVLIEVVWLSSTSSS